MKSSFATTILTACCCSLIGNVEAAGIKSAITFQADYTQSQTDYTAQIAAGQARGTLVHEAKYQVDFEPMATVNNGALIGRDCATISYDSAQNLPAETGSIELVVSSKDWAWNDKDVHVFLNSCDAKHSLYIYKHADDGLGCYLAVGKTHVFPRSARVIKKWKKNEKHHILVTYGQQQVQLYLDGSRIWGASFPATVKFARKFQIGSGASKWGRAGQSTVSLVTFYNRVLNAPEIAALAQSRLPDLKIVAARPALPLRELPASTFFPTQPREALEALDAKFVPYPWTPVTVKLPQIAVWNRTYDLSGSGLLKSVRSANRELLAAPIVFKTTGNTPLELSAPQLQSQAPGRVIITRNLQLKNQILGQVSYRFEYDGALFIGLKLAPNYNPQDLVLSVPMPKALAQMIHYTGTVVDSLYSIVGPEFSYSKTLPPQNGLIWQGGLHTTVWLGDNRGGLQFFTESDRGFFPKDRKNYFTVERQANQVELKINYLTAAFPAAAQAERTYEFGLMATPVRPMPKRWREWRLSAQFDSIQGRERGNILVYWPDDWMWMGLDPDPVRARNKAYVGQKIVLDRQNNRKIVPYYDKTHLKHISKSWVNPKEMLVNPDVKNIIDKWGMFPQRQASFSGHMVRVSTASPWSDYLVWCLKNFDKLYGKVDGFYMDEMELSPNTNPASGGGYTAYDGTIRSTYSLRADRDLYKRMNYVAAHGDPRAETFNIAHCSGTHMMPLVGHFPILLVAEHLYSGYFTKGSQLLPPANDQLYYYSYALPMDRVKAEFYHQQWGCAIAWLPCLKNQRDIMTRTEPTRDMLSRIMHADVLFWPLWCNAKVIHQVWDIRNQFKIGDEDVTFVPYWENKLIQSSDPESAISYYRGKDNRYLVLVSNLARQERTLKLTFAPELAIKSALEAESRHNVPLKNHKLEIKIPRNDYRLLWLNFQPEK